MYTTISNKIDNLEQFCLSLINKMKNITSVEDLMELKKQYIINWVEHMPNLDYKCVNCTNKKCKYCYINRFKKSKKKLQKAINKYYIGEQYGINLNNEIKEMLINNLTDNLKIAIKNLKAKLNNFITTASTKNFISILYLWSNTLPIQGNICYFCLIGNCIECKYKEIHNVCGENKSDYKKLFYSLISLKSVLIPYL